MKRLTLIGGMVAVLIIVGLGAIIFTRHAKAPVGPVGVKGSYVALGDSVAAGVGLATYSDASACDRTNESYPHLVATQLNLQLTSFACSGASMSAGILTPQTVNGLRLPTQQDQLFTLPKPKLISFTIGANDSGWETAITKCYTAVCGSSDDTAVITARLNTLAGDLDRFLTSIQSHYSGTAPDVVITSYYQIFPTQQAPCSSITNVDQSELAWIAAQQTRLDQTLAMAATRFSFAHFAPVNFSGHDLCSNQPWLQDFQAKAPFHPNAQGEPAYAAAVVKASGLH